MPTALLTVKTTITAARETAFNEWYNQEHIPDLFKFNGVVGARRYKAIMPEDKFQYIALYEFESEETLQRFLKSEHFAWLKKETDTHFGDVCERQRAAYVQVWP
jgi:antibiotic biosynthesis monooxygenase (ABM) superfamily enzyme